MPLANQYSAGLVADEGGAEALADRVRAFVASCREPAVSEPGEDLLALTPGQWTLEHRAGAVYLEAWDDRRSLTRRLLGAGPSNRNRMDLTVQRFGKRLGSVSLLDRRAPSNHAAGTRASRECSLQEFHRRLCRQFPGACIDVLTTGTDLEHSLSPSFPRALIRHGGFNWAAMAAPRDPLRATQVLSFGLIWLDYLRRRRRERVQGLALFVPEGAENPTCLRLLHLDPAAARFAVFSCPKGGGEVRVDLADFGNVDTRAARGRSEPGPTEASGPAEHELELRVRASIDSLDPRLLPTPVYRQALGSAACQRGILDLLAVGRDGRLTIVELKVSEDIHLPMQALDYWIRVKWHLDRGELTARGYFPGIEVRREPPRILLAAPALDFHPTNATVLSFFAPGIEVERAGIGAGWRNKIEVMFRV